MAGPARTLLSELPKGHQFATTTFDLTADAVSAYLDAVQDGNGVYAARGLAPPLAVAARALGALLEVMELPAGTLHTGQEVTARAGIPIGATLTLAGVRDRRCHLALFEHLALRGRRLKGRSGYSISVIAWLPAESTAIARWIAI